MFSDKRNQKNFLKAGNTKNKSLDERLKNLETWEAATGPRWDDLRTPVNSIKLAGIRDPGFAVLLSDGLGSMGVWTYLFDAGVEEEVFLMVQLPHSWYKGTDLYPHVHWTPPANGAAGEVVSWGLEYAVANIGEGFGSTNIIYANAHAPADSDLVQYKHYVTPFAALDGSLLDYSAMFLFRVFRDAAGVGLTDDYPNDAALLEFDIHYQVNSLGTKEQF